MRYITNPAGNRIVDATPEEMHALRPTIAMNIRWRHISEAEVEDFCQEVEIITWQALVDRRIVGNDFARPVDALIHFMLAVAHNLWRNHQRKRWVQKEVFPGVLPDIEGPAPDARLDARETLLRLTMREDIARFLLESLTVPPKVRYADVPTSTYWSRLADARKWAREVDAGHWKEPKQHVSSRKRWAGRRKG